MRERPVFALAKRKDPAEQLLGLPAVQEVLLIRCTLIGIAGRDRNADAQIPGKVQELRNVFGLGAIENGGVDVDSKAFGLCSEDRGQGPVENAVLTDRLVVMFFQAVEVN